MPLLGLEFYTDRQIDWLSVIFLGEYGLKLSMLLSARSKIV